MSVVRSLGVGGIAVFLFACGGGSQPDPDGPNADTSGLGGYILPVARQDPKMVLGFDATCQGKVCSSIGYRVLSGTVTRGGATGMLTASLQSALHAGVAAQVKAGKVDCGGGGTFVAKSDSDISVNMEVVDDVSYDPPTVVRRECCRTSPIDRKVEPDRHKCKSFIVTRVYKTRSIITIKNNIGRAASANAQCSIPAIGMGKVDATLSKSADGTITMESTGWNVVDVEPPSYACPSPPAN